jgi:hypothetical protein
MSSSFRQDIIDSQKFVEVSLGRGSYDKVYFSTGLENVTEVAPEIGGDTPVRVVDENGAVLRWHSEFVI